MFPTNVTIRILIEDALKTRADVLVLKHAQAHHGADEVANIWLAQAGRKVQMPTVGQTVICDSTPVLGATQTLFVGMPELLSITYEHVRDFGRLALEALAREAPAAQHVALTLHGPGFGLDEIEAFESELAGIVDAITAHTMPPALTTVSFIEMDVRRASRLELALRRLLPTGSVTTEAGLHSLQAATQVTLRSAGYDSAAKPRVFVAMPFAPEMDDIFHYGIQGAANAAGLLCERADLETFTGDVMDWVKTRISNASFVIADLSNANANVYLEVGYAWGRGIPTVLLAKDSADLKFDVRSQRCLIYKSIKHLEELLARELRALIQPK